MIESSSELTSEKSLWRHWRIVVNYYQIWGYLTHCPCDVIFDFLVWEPVVSGGVKIIYIFLKKNKKSFQVGDVLI